MKDNFFKTLLFIAALAIAGTAAYFSIIGLSKTFAGAVAAIIILGSALEFGKIIAVSCIVRYKNSIKGFLKYFLYFCILGVMVITSIGIYGFLSNAYESSASKLTLSDSQIELFESKKKSFNSQITRYNEQIELKTKRITSLTELRNSQEVRLDSLYLRDNWISHQGAASVEANIKEANKNIDTLTNQITALTIKINICNDSIANYDVKVIGEETEQSTSELGPLKYISRLTDKSMDVVVNWFIFLLIFVFDPFAIALVITFNRLTLNKVEIKQTKKNIRNYIPNFLRQKPKLFNKKYKNTKNNIADKEIFDKIYTEPNIADTIDSETKIIPDVEDTVENEDEIEKIIDNDEIILEPSDTSFTVTDLDNSNALEELEKWANKKGPEKRVINKVKRHMNPDGSINS